MAANRALETVVSDRQRACLERLLASETMIRAPRLLAVLKFIVESLLQGRGDEISEQSIGQEVFGKPVGYSSSDDNIVRVTIRHLRLRLEDYYRDEGRNEPCILEIPKGKYVPLLLDRLEQSAPPPPTVDTEALVDKWPSPAVPAAPRRSVQKTLWALSALLFLSNLLFGFLLFRSHPAERNAAGADLLTLLTENGTRMTVVVTDADLLAYREIFRKQVSLDAYINRSYSHPDQPLKGPLEAGVWHYIGGTTETSVTSAIVAAEIQKAVRTIGVEIKHPHDLSMRDLQHESLVLLGGPWINPWGQLFEDKLNFRIVPVDGSPAASEIQNLNSQTGEPKVFAPHQVSGQTINYVRIAMLPNLNHSGRVILIGATSLEALEAGGDYLVGADSGGDLSRRFKVLSVHQIPSFEIVLEVEGLGAVPGKVRVVAQRVIASAP